MTKPAVFIAATRQHVGKTSSCLGIVSGMAKRFDRVGFIKPVGQEHVKAANVRVDKDVRLIREHFKLQHLSYEDMSPVVIPAGYTRAYLDDDPGYSDQDAHQKVVSAYERISASSEVTVVEGTGHVGVGSICNLSNAQVASLLQVPMVLVVNGGLGKAFDELSLNRALCLAEGVRMKGVIVNKVQNDKLEMIREYMEKALKRWDLPLIGVIPDAEYLGRPTMLDFEHLFKTKLISGHKWRSSRHFTNVELVTTGLSKFLEKCDKYERVTDHVLVVAHASRNDIILGYLTYANRVEHERGEPFRGGLLLTGTPYAATGGANQVPQFMMPYLRDAPIPVLYAPFQTYEVMAKMERYTAKLNVEDIKRTEAVASHYEKHIDFEQLLS